MTRIARTTINCSCGNYFNVVYYASINTFISPDVESKSIQGLIDGTGYNFKCEKCGKIHHLSITVIVNCPQGMINISTNEDPEKIKRTLTYHGVLDKDGKVVDGFTERLTMAIKMKDDPDYQKKVREEREKFENDKKEFLEDIRNLGKLNKNNKKNKDD